jgi:DNA topoisomerase-1
VQLLESTLIRVGNDEYARSNQSYGLTTLRHRHVAIAGSRLVFRFRGKSGQQHEIALTDRKLARIVRHCRDLPGQELFQYIDENGDRQAVSSGDVNDYIRQVAGDEFSAKDFRTWAGTIICACALARSGAEASDTSTARKRKVVAAIKETAEMLGNTPAVCRSSYINPAVIGSFEKGRIIDGYFETLEDLIAYRGRKLHRAEQGLLRFLKREAK